MAEAASFTALYLNVSSIEAHRKFWVDTLGGVSGPAEAGRHREVVKLPHVTLFLALQQPTGGTKGTTINHVGFQVPSARAAVDRLRAAGYPIVTAAEVSSANAKNIKDDLAFVENQNTFIAYTMAPDEVKVELVENKALTVPFDVHHIHFFTPQVDEMRAWYVHAFGAKPGKRGSFEAADLPGVNLSFSPVARPQVGTKGRVLDRLGFTIYSRGPLHPAHESRSACGAPSPRAAPLIVTGLNLPAGLISDAWGTALEIRMG
jgi:catechol 2,3-dioxygenase-like lactoylglutathione lyase family enzyme